MSYTTAIEEVAVITPDTLTQEFGCGEAQKACMPAFVFSVAGQVGFRKALDHLVDCKNKD